MMFIPAKIDRGYAKTWLSNIPASIFVIDIGQSVVWNEVFASDRRSIRLLIFSFVLFDRNYGKHD